MRSIFNIYASHGKTAYVELGLPATDYELLDMMECLRLEEGQLPYTELWPCDDFKYLENKIPELPDIYQLNALAKRLSELDVKGSAAFEGAVCLEIQKGTSTIPLSRLIDFAYSGECYHIVEDAATDYELGRFLAENRFVPEAENLPAAAFELLDFIKIGKAHRETNGGVFTPWGYVEPLSEPKQVSEGMDFRPRLPPYTVLLNISNIPDSSMHDGKQKTLTLRLPTAGAQIQEALDQLGKHDWSGVGCLILDSSVPSVNRQVYLEDDIPLVIKWAESLRKLDTAGSILKYKAVLAVTECKFAADMIALADDLDEYSFDPTVRSTEDIARNELKKGLGEDSAGSLIPFVKLSDYGCSLLVQRQGKITDYGLIERKDGQPIQTMEDQPQRGGMEMT